MLAAAAGALRRALLGRPVAHASLPSLPCGGSLTLQTTQQIPIGGQLHPMSLALCRLLLAERQPLRLAGRSCMELGSGTGAVGIFAAGLGAAVTLTDQRLPRSATQAPSFSSEGEAEYVTGDSPHQLTDLLLRNVAANAALCALPLAVLELHWGDSRLLGAATRAAPCSLADGGDAMGGSAAGVGYSLILGSDITYEQSAFAALAASISALMLPGGLALIAHETRLTGLRGADIQLDGFAAAARAAGLRVAIEALPDPQPGSSGYLLRLSHAGGVEVEEDR